MTFVEEWLRISARIRGFRAACELFSSFQAAGKGDSNGKAKRLREQSGVIVTLIEAFGSTHAKQLPSTALEAVGEFVKHAKPLATQTSSTNDAVLDAFTAAALLVVTFESEMTFLLSNEQLVLRRLSERAFVHLQRSIVADERVREQWQKAFDRGEVACEQLGAVHLLSHGLFCFKADAIGARTDLIFPDIVVGDDVARFAEGLVLTEWKVAKPDTVASSKFFGNARQQAGRYAAGALAGMELAGYRYVVVVTKKAVELPPDAKESGWICRHINIAVSPDTPSRKVVLPEC